MTESFLKDSTELSQLYRAAERIDSAFKPLAGLSLSDEEIDDAESLANKDIRIVYQHLFALAVAELKIRSRSSDWFFLNTVSYEFDEIAHLIAASPFSRREDTGFLELTGLIMRFFHNKKTLGKENFFYYLKGITGNNFNQVIKQISRSEKKLYHYVYTAVTRHIRKSPRYERTGDTITDMKTRETGSSWREASIEEVIEKCSSGLNSSKTPGSIVDMIFDIISRDGRFSSRLHISTLRSATFELIKSRFTSPAMKITHFDPMQEYIQSDMLLLADEALAETISSYGWRNGGSADFREVYEKVGRDLLVETIMDGERSPVHEIFSMYLKDNSDDEYREKHRGSFQNFWNVLWNNFLKKIRADL